MDLRGHPEAKAVKELMILRPSQPLFFAYADRILNQIRKKMLAVDPSVHSFVISLEESPDLDSSILEVLKTFFELTGKSNQQLILTRLKHPAYSLLLQLLASQTDTTNVRLKV